MCYNPLCMNELEEDYTLSIECDRYLGLDRTDSGRLGHTVKTATATLDPECDGATVTWISCGSLCEFVEGDRVVTKPTGWTVSYRNKDPDTPSTEVDAEELVAEVTIPGKDGTIRASKRFTVVKVDISVGGTGEDVEESTAKEVYDKAAEDSGEVKYAVSKLDERRIPLGRRRRGVGLCAAVVVHEMQHKKNQERCRVDVDTDSDRCSDEDEAGSCGLTTHTGWRDTFDVAQVLLVSEYARYGDDEVRCRWQETKSSVDKRYHIEKDWANPGCQHKDPYGPF